MRKTQPRRDWGGAREKVDRQGVCAFGRAGGCEGRLEAAHVVGRVHDVAPAVRDPEMGSYYVHPDRVVPACSKHHRAYDAGELDLVEFLSTEEQVQAVADAGSIVAALRRTAPVFWGGLTDRRAA